MSLWKLPLYLGDKIEYEMAQKQKIPQMARPKWLREKQRQKPFQNPARQENANNEGLLAEALLLQKPRKQVGRAKTPH